MERDAVHYDTVDSTSCNNLNLDRAALVPSVGRLPLLCVEPGLDLNFSSNDLYVCDQYSWHCIRGLLNLLEDKDVEFYSGISIGCVLLAFNERRFAWTLRQSTSHLEGGDVNVFHWFHIPQQFQTLMESYVRCRALHMESTNSISAALDKTGCVYRPSTILKVNLVMTVARDLEFYTTQCIYLPFDDIVDRTKCGVNVCRVPSFPQYVFQIIPVSQITAKSVHTCDSEVKCSKEAYFPINASTHSEELGFSGDATTSFPIADVDVYESDLKWLKTEQDVHEQEEGGEKQQHDQHVLQVSQKIPKRNFVRKVVKFKMYEKLVEIAKCYKDLSCKRRRDAVAYPYCRVWGPSLIIECPGCSTPCRNTPSAFLNLLRHVPKRHPQYSSILLDDIEKRYAGFIDYMKRKIESKTRRQYVQKLRKHKKNLVNCGLGAHVCM